MDPSTIAVAIQIYQAVSPLARSAIDALVNRQEPSAEAIAAAQAETASLMEQMRQLLPPGVTG